MTLLQQTKHLLYRNYLLKIRNKKETCREILVPIFFMAILAGTKSGYQIKDEPAIERKNIPAFTLIRDFSLFSNRSNSTPSSVAVVSNNLEKAKDVVDVLKAYGRGRINFTEDKTVQEMTDTYRTQKEKFAFGIVFEQSNTSYLGIKYTLLSPFKSQPKTNQKIVDTTRCRNGLTGGSDCPANDYLIHRIVTFQAVIDAAFKAVGESKSSLTEPNVTVQMMPKPKYQTSLQGFFITAALYLVMSFAPIVTVLLITLVREKESKIKESMKIMGMKTLAYWLAWGIVYLTVILVVSLLMLVISLPSKIFGNSNGLCIFLFLYLYGLSLVTMSFMLTPFFKRAKVAGALGSVSTLVFAVMTLPVTLLDVPVALKWIISLLSPAAFTLGLSKGASAGNGLQFSNLFDSEDSFPSGYAIIMIIVDIILYMILALYFDTVIPGEYGQRRPAYFCFLPSFWKGLFGYTASDQNVNRCETNLIVGIQANEDVEPVAAELSGKQAVRICNLRKVFKGANKEDVVAVNDVSLDVYEGQITALLGHNGAGKTTLLSMLTGLIPSTSGTAKIYGHDINTDYGLEKIRQMTGACPQPNILFDNLTPVEHLKFFAGIKDIPQERVEPEIETLLNDVDLAKERDTFAKNLSGGQKRKLCLAVSLIGDPKVVFLDEPTSGMDPYSRRFVWALLKRKSKDRVIFMTTHFMDEADILADCKAIMSYGKLRTAGSSLFLKNRFGIGYHLNMTIDESCDVRSMTQLVQSHVPGANVAGDHGNELRYTLPLDAVDQFADLFSMLEKSNSAGEICTAPELGVKSYAVSMTTLEEVFLRLGEEEEETTDERDDDEREDDQVSRDSVCTVDVLGDVGGTNINTLKQTQGVNTGRFFLQRQQFKALFKVLFLGSLRSPLKVIFHVLLPPVILLIGFIISSSRSSDSVDVTQKLELSPSLYLTDASTESYAAPLLLQNSTALINNLVAEFKERKIRSDVVGSLTGLLKNYPHNIALDIMNTSMVNSSYSLLYNDSTIHALPLAINIADSVVLSVLRNVSSVIETYVQAFPGLTDVFSFDAVAFNSALLIGIALVMVPGGFVTTVVLFKELKCQHQLRVSGVSTMVYWGAFFAFDFLTLSIPVVLTLILVPAFGVKSFLAPGAMVALILALIIYMNLAIVLAYVMSFLFTSWAAASSAAPSLYSMAAILGYLTVSLVDLLSYQDNPDVPIILHYVFLVIDPPYAIMGAVYYIDRVYRVESIRQQSLDVTPDVSQYFSWTKGNGVPAALLVPAIQLVLFSSLLFYLDFKSRGKNCPLSKCCRRTSDVASLETRFERDDDDIVDDDVTTERKRVMNESFDTSSDNHAVVSKGVWKYFTQNKVPKVVVRDLNFSVDSGEVFALLGPNGAGKTTFMNIITCDLKASAGKVFVAGNDTSSNAEQAYGHLGFCPQVDALWDDITLEEHLHCYAHVKGVPPGAVKDHVESFMTAMKIKEHRKKKAKNLSGGTKRKLQFGMSLLGDPQLLLLDEPSSGLDPRSRRFLWDMIQQNIRGGRGAILTTHSMEEADAVSSRVGIMVKGEMRAIGSTQHLKNKFGSGFTLEVKLSPINHETESEQRFEVLDGYIKENFPGAQIHENFGLRASYKVPRSSVVALSKTFTVLERGKQVVGIEEYSFSQTTLEQVFLELAREQDDERTGRSEKQETQERSGGRRSKRGSSRLSNENGENHGRTNSI